MTPVERRHGQQWPLNIEAIEGKAGRPAAMRIALLLQCQVRVASLYSACSKDTLLTGRHASQIDLHELGSNGN